MNKYQRIQYKDCKVFNDGKGGIITNEIDKNGQIVFCCYGATNDVSDWADICEECRNCRKWIQNVIDGKDGSE